MRIALLCLSLLPLNGFALRQSEPDTMLPIENYLMEEAFEIALAVSAAPEHVGAAATVLVLSRDGYHEVRAGTNGFTCLVERSWSSPLVPERPTTDFWNPRLRAPICFNPEAARSVLDEYLRRTELAMAGKNRAEMKRAIDLDIAEGRLRMPHGLAFSYMASAGQLLGTQVGQYKPHIMLYAPYAREEDLGSNSPTSEFPVMFEHEGGPFATVIVPLPRFVEVREVEGAS